MIACARSGVPASSNGMMPGPPVRCIWRSSAASGTNSVAVAAADSGRDGTSSGSPGGDRGEPSRGARRGGGWGSRGGGGGGGAPPPAGPGGGKEPRGGGGGTGEEGAGAVRRPRDG